MDKALRIARNLIKIGQVNSVNPSQGTVQVLFPDKDDLVSNDLPMLNHEYNMPNVGDQVLCLFLGNGLETGVCLGSFYSEVSPPPANKKEIYKKQLDKDTYLEYNKNTKLLKMNVDSVEIEINQGKVIIKANEILLGDTATEGVPLGNQLKAWLDNHTHEYTWTESGGNGTTSPPTPSPEPSQVVKVK